MNGAQRPGALAPPLNGNLKSLPVDQNGGMNATQAGQLANGVHQSDQFPDSSLNRALINGSKEVGNAKLSTQMEEMPLEIRQQLQGAFMPMEKLISRSAQECWNRLSSAVEELAAITQSSSNASRAESLSAKPIPNGIPVNDQSRANLDKKDRLLNLASDQKAKFIKLLVLLQWGKDAEEVRRALELNFWLHQQRAYYIEAAFETGLMKREFANLQIPNPDLKTAAEILAFEKGPSISALGYIPHKPLSAREILRTFKTLDNLLCSRLTLSDDIPPQFRNFQVHDGRVTFTVLGEFELDLFALDEDATSQFYFLDLRFTFSPSSTVLAASLHNDFSYKVNSTLSSDGLLGCYNFLHDLSLSYKLNVLHRQALDLLRGQWSNNLRIELIRRTLVVQYWSNRPAAKSWIEIGINSGSQKMSIASDGPRDAFLDIKWMKEQKQVENAAVAFDTVTLSVESILRQVIALHSSNMFDAIYDSLSASTLYATDDLAIEQTYSTTEPTDCRIELQLTKIKPISINIEPVTGALVISPASPSSVRIEHEMSTSKTVIQDLLPKLNQLRCLTAEQDLTGLAESAGWQVLRMFKPTPAEVRNLFGSPVFRSVFLRQPYWENEYMVAATRGPEGDFWWLIQQDLASQTVTSWTSQLIQSRSMHAEDNLSYAYMTRLEDYLSGRIVLQSNAAFLASISVHFALPAMPRFENKYRLPDLSFEFQPAKFKSMLGIETTTTDWAQSVLQLTRGNSTSQRSWIRKTIRINLHHVDKESNRAILVARGQSSANAKVLKYLAGCDLQAGIKISPAEGRFSIRLETQVGKPVIEDLFRYLSYLENLIACLSTVHNHPDMAVTSLTFSDLSIRYRKGPPKDLVLHIKFSSDTSPLRLEMLPYNENPHGRIATQLRKVLVDPRSPLPTNLRYMLPLLSFTYPLVSLFQTIQNEALEKSPSPTSAKTDRSIVTPRVHIVSRHPTMYGLQYFAPQKSNPSVSSTAEGSSRMLARFEILPSSRKQQSYWILRPAMEEFESYTRPSFCSQELEQKLKEEIFSKRDESGGWLPLGNGASCHVHKPDRLLRTLHEVMVNWTRTHPLTNEDAGVGNAVPEIVKPKTSQVKQQQPPPPATAARGQKPQSNGANQARARMAAATGKGSAPKSQEVITLD